jgi:hypothetical protein
MTSKASQPQIVMGVDCSTHTFSEKYRRTRPLLLLELQNLD